MFVEPRKIQRQTYFYTLASRGALFYMIETRIKLSDDLERPRRFGLEAHVTNRNGMQKQKILGVVTEIGHIM